VELPTNEHEWTQIMKNIHYLEITNFKTFGDPVRIELGHPAVLIGPNNCGKTSAIQALALWSLALQTWHRERSESKREARISVGLNRLNILTVPVAEARFFWHNTRVRSGQTPIELSITVGVEYQRAVHPCTMVLKYQTAEVVYAQPSACTLAIDGLVEHANGLRFDLMYPMSGIEIEEPLVQEGRINVLMGQGQTAQVLRNLCYKVYETDDARRTHDWVAVQELVHRLFRVKLGKPMVNNARGSLELTYEQEGVSNALDIAMAGRGMQQMVLLLAYLYAHKGSILLIDEPDAHLDILRQKQVYSVLREIADKNGSQVIIATHSEVILEDAVDRDLTLLINGTAVDLAQRQDMRNALRVFGIEHYYKARAMPRILYVEGSSDIDMLKALARKLDHPVGAILEQPLNTYYTRDVEPELTLDGQIDRASGHYQNHKAHFHTVKRFVPEFRGIAVLDRDSTSRQDDVTDELAIVYWKHYELENYFISVQTLSRYVLSDAGGAEPDLFVEARRPQLAAIIRRRLLADVFSGRESDLDGFLQANLNLQIMLLTNTKMSAFAERVFAELAEATGEPLLLSKGEFHKLVEVLEPGDIPDEVREKLDLLHEYLGLAGEGEAE